MAIRLADAEGWSMGAADVFGPSVIARLGGRRASPCNPSRAAARAQHRSGNEGVPND